jgi:hypothetical protein
MLKPTGSSCPDAGGASVRIVNICRTRSRACNGGRSWRPTCARGGAEARRRRVERRVPTLHVIPANAGVSLPDSRIEGKRDPGLRRDDVKGEHRSTSAPPHPRRLCASASLREHDPASDRRIPPDPMACVTFVTFTVAWMQQARLPRLRRTRRNRQVRQLHPHPPARRTAIRVTLVNLAVAGQPHPLA